MVWVKVLQLQFNSSCERLPLFSHSLDDLKFAEFVPMYKNNNPLDKENYRPVTLLSRVLRFLKIKKFIQDIIHTIYHLTCIMDIISQLLFCSYWYGLNKKAIKRSKLFFFSWFVWLSYFLNTKTVQIFVMTWELVPGHNFLRQSSSISVMIFKFCLLEWAAFLILFRNLNTGIWIHFFIYWYYLRWHITLNTGPIHQHKLQCLIEWRFKNKRYPSHQQ